MKRRYWRLLIRLNHITRTIKNGVGDMPDVSNGNLRTLNRNSDHRLQKIAHAFCLQTVPLRLSDWACISVDCGPRMMQKGKTRYRIGVARLKSERPPHRWHKLFRFSPLGQIPKRIFEL